MKSKRINSNAVAWWTATAAVAVILYGIALSDTVYNLTSPPGPFQILIRKTYSVVAFALVGWLFARALRASGREKPIIFAATAVAVYSALIEIGQAMGSTYEGIGWNLVDVACGFIGALLGASVSALQGASLNRKRPAKDL